MRATRTSDGLYSRHERPQKASSSPAPPSASRSCDFGHCQTPGTCKTARSNLKRETMAPRGSEPISNLVVLRRRPLRRPRRTRPNHGDVRGLLNRAGSALVEREAAWGGQLSPNVACLPPPTKAYLVAARSFAPRRSNYARRAPVAREIETGPARGPTSLKVPRGGKESLKRSQGTVFARLSSRGPPPTHCFLRAASSDSFPLAGTFARSTRAGPRSRSRATRRAPCLTSCAEPRPRRG